MYIVIATNNEIHHDLRNLIVNALKPFDQIKIELGKTPGLSTFLQVDEWHTGIDFIITGHRHNAVDWSQAVVKPPVPDSVRYNAVQIAVIDSSHVVVNSVIELLRIALEAVVVTDSKVITCPYGDFTDEQVVLFLDDVQEHTAYIINQKPKRMQDLVELLGRSFRLESNP